MITRNTSPQSLNPAERSAWVLCYQKGGVAAEIRRLVYCWKGAFRAYQIRSALLRRYPGIDVPSFMLHSTLDRMEKWKQVAVIEEDSAGKLYRRLPRRPAVKQLRQVPLLKEAA